MNVLFLSIGNSCRSIFAEATFNHLAPKGWRAMSAGSNPIGQVHLWTIALLEREGIATEGLYSKSWDNLPAMPDIVITVCGNTTGEICPNYHGPTLRAHWGVCDPTKIIGTEEEINAAFTQVYRTLREGIETFLSLPLDNLQLNTSAFRTKLDYIGILKFKQLNTK